MSRNWTVEIGGGNYKVEAQYGGLFSYGSGKALVDGKVVDAWGPCRWGLIPKERSFEIAGKKAVLRRTGLMVLNLELSVPEATKISRVK